MGQYVLSGFTIYNFLDKSKKVSSVLVVCGGGGGGGSQMDEMGYAPIRPKMLGNTQSFDCLGENGYNAKSLDCLLIVAQNSQ